MAIRLLPHEVSSKIAAGEVTERPASVVKELVENSLDAGATQVSVEIRGGGVDYIRVVDNGCGIPSGEVELAFQRFATSKIAAAGDLESIATLGFRGEALPSIATVGTVTLVTRAIDDELGSRLEVANGNVTDRAPEGAAYGTMVTVRHLFRDFPARRKFLRTPATETSRVQTLVTRYAMAYPEVRFELAVEGAAGFASPGTGSLQDAFAAVYGLEVAQAMLDIAAAEEDGGAGPFVSGMMSPPSTHRANRSHISFFVNRRWVQSRTLTYALEQAYHGFMMERRHPVAVVNIVVPADEIDVNVHPAKAEVRFRREGQVFSALQRAARHTLTAHSPVPTLRATPSASPDPHREPRGPGFWPLEPFPGARASERASAHEPSIRHQSGCVGQAEAPPRDALPALRVLGQVQNTYVVAEGADGMYLIDQHAAHERVVFERVGADMQTRSSQVQALLEPAAVELDPRQREVMEAQAELFSSLGFDVEPFGGSAVLLRGVPALLAGGAPGQTLIDVLDSIAEGGGFDSWEERAAYSIACHGAIRAGKGLSQEEMAELVRQLEACLHPGTCPHGRPTMIHLSSTSLEREFGRR